VRGDLSLAVDLPPPVSGHRSVRPTNRTLAKLWLAHLRLVDSVSEKVLKEVAPIIGLGMAEAAAKPGAIGGGDLLVAD
jgi:hypothetical protein